MSLSILIEQKNALEEAIFSGARKVKYADREVEYRSVREMSEALSFLNKKISKLQGKRKGLSKTYQMKMDKTV